MFGDFLFTNSFYVMIFVCVGVMYSGEYDECGSTPGKLKSLPDHGGNRTHDLWDTRFRSRQSKCFSPLRSWVQFSLQNHERVCQRSTKNRGFSPVSSHREC